ncbi:MAG: HAMP domain-containing histidine kinase [Clostridiaceae bacterium]|nr:HAMP domain-containing histidine kinase [Clostridiaceae bacterium]
MPFNGRETGGEKAYIQHDGIIVMHLYDFYFSDGSEGSIFLYIDTQNIRRKIAVLQYSFTIISSIALVLINGVITVFVYRSIITPLRKLEYAANQIKEGNLDTVIENEFKDEFGEVIESFEEMRKRLKKSTQLQHQYEQDRKILISNISHDLKTPITAIKGYVEGIRDGVADTPEKMEKYIDTIYKKASQMDVLIDDLFLFSKLDLHEHPFDFTKINIVDYIEDIIEEIRFDLEEKQISLYFDSPGNPIYVKGDVNNLRRVFTNIIDNSIKYASDVKLVIKVNIVEREDDVLIEVSDNGKGISGNALPYIFDRFYRADQSRNTNTGGSGLGLAIVKRIIEEHGGKVWAESKVNVGTNIYFTLKKISVEEE